MGIIIKIPVRGHHPSPLTHSSKAYIPHDVIYTKKLYFLWVICFYSYIFNIFSRTKCNYEVKKFYIIYIVPIGAISEYFQIFDVQQHIL